MKIVKCRLAIVGIVLIMGLSGCYKEDKLTPSEDGEPVYSENVLPQGNHEYDEVIMEMFQKWQTLFLYKYEEKDLYYNVTEYLGGSYDVEKDSTVAGLFDVPSNEDWVGEQLKLLQELWLGYYPDDFLKRLPHKVYLVDSLFSATSGIGRPQQNIRDNWLTHSGNDYMLVTYGSVRIQNMTQEEKIEYKKELHKTFLEELDLPVPADFSAISNYSIFSNTSYKEYIYAYGFLNWDYSKTPQDDWMSYLDMVLSFSYEELTSEGEHGYLHVSKDSQGLIREKYDLLLAHFREEYQIDLYKIANDFVN